MMDHNAFFLQYVRMHSKNTLSFINFKTLVKDNNLLCFVSKVLPAEAENISPIHKK